MKKMLALLLAVCLTASFAACGAPSGNKGGKAYGGTDGGGTAGEPNGSAAKDEKADASSDASEDSKGKEIEISLWTYPVGNWGNPVVVAGLISDFMDIRGGRSVPMDIDWFICGNQLFPNGKKEK